MRETSIKDNLNCKTQDHARVCKENNELEKENDAYWYNFAVKGASLKDHIGRVRGHIKMIFSRMIHHSIKVLVVAIWSYITINACVSRVLAVVMETSAKTCGLASSYEWLRQLNQSFS